MKSIIRVDNLKCGGCANTVKKQLLSFSDIAHVTVFPEKDMIELDHTDSLDMAAVKQKLKSLGYPESGTAQGLDKLTSGMRSYVSCAIGRISGESKAEDDKSHAQK